MLNLSGCARSHMRLQFCIILAALSQSGFCVNLESSRLLRNEREASVERLQLGADGGLLNVVANETPPTATAWGEPVVSDQDNLESHSEPCDLDFPFGVQNSNACDNRSTYGAYSNLSLSQCIFAAEKAGAKTVADSFEVPPEWQDVHPKGCFVFPCETSSWCYYANEDGDMPHGHIYGRPVCRRDRYIHGTAVDGADVNDPRLCNDPEYEVIETEEACRKFASCLGDCEDHRFGIGQIHFADKDIYPPGCFLRHSSASARACVNWNDPKPLADGGAMFAPKNPVGTPICVVSTPDHVSKLKKTDFGTTSGGE